MVGSEPSGTVDMEQALLNPGSVFATPEEVLAHDGLTQQQKIDILQRWQYDASDVAVAEEEGMQGDTNDMFRRILLALGQLTGGVDVERVGPSKQHGIPRSAIKSK
jgi:hypothetical protein